MFEERGEKRDVFEVPCRWRETRGALTAVGCPKAARHAPCLLREDEEGEGRMVEIRKRREERRERRDVFEERGERRDVFEVRGERRDVLL